MLFVHGIGKQAEGQTVRAFGDPILAYLEEALLPSGASDAAQKWPIAVAETSCEDCVITGHHRHFQISGMAVDGLRVREWVFVEFFWDNLVENVPAVPFNGWINRVVPQLILWQTATATISGVYRRLDGPLKFNPVSWFAWLCAMVLNTVLRPFLTYFLASGTSNLELPPEPDLDRGWRARYSRAIANTLGDAHAFVDGGVTSTLITSRFWRAYLELRAASGKTAVIGHSQGGALAHHSFKSNNRPPDLLVGVGSGLGILGAARLPPAGKFPRLKTGATVLVYLLAWGLISDALVRTMVILTTFVVLPICLGALLIAAVLAYLAIDLIPGGEIDPTFVPALLSQLAGRAPGFWTNLQDTFTELFVRDAISLLFAFVIFRIGRMFVPVPRVVRSEDLAIRGLPREKWVEIYSPLDPVSVGTAANRSATRVRVFNPAGWRIWNEHSSYFRPGSPAVSAIGSRLAAMEGFLAGPVRPHRSASRLFKWAILECSPVAAWLIFYVLWVAPRIFA